MVERWVGGFCEYLRGLRRRFAGAEHGLRISQGVLNPGCGRVRATEDAPGNAFYFLERRHGLAEVVERCCSFLVERPRIIPSCWQVELQYLVRHRTHRGASWASGAAQAAHFVRIIFGLRWGAYEVARGGDFRSSC